MSNYIGAFNSTNIDADEAELVDATVDNLVVTTSVELPDLMIPSSWIISLNGDKINNPLLIDTITEKTSNTGVTIEGITLKDGLITTDLTIDASLTVNGGVTTSSIITDNLSSTSSINVDARLELADVWIKDSNQSHFYKIVPSNLSAHANLTLPNISSDEFLFKSASQTISGKTILDSNIFANYSNENKRLQFDLATITAPYLRTIVIPDANGTMTLDSNTQTLTNKTISYANNTMTLSASDISTGSLSASRISSGTVANSNFDYLYGLNQYLSVSSSPTFNVITAYGHLKLSDSNNSNYYNIRTSDLVNDHDITIPGVSNDDQYFVLSDTTQTITGKTYVAPIIADASNVLKQAIISTTLLTPSVTRYWYTPDFSDTFVGVAGTQTLTNKTLTSPIITSISNGSQLLNFQFQPSSSDTVVTRTSADTLTNKTISSAVFSGTQTSTFTHSGLHDNTNTTNATSTTSNSAIKTAGGISVAKDIWAANFYGRYQNPYTCQLTYHGNFYITPASTYVKITTLASSNANGFNNLNGNMDYGSGSIYIPVTGKYRISGKCYINSGGPSTVVFGKNGSPYDQAFDLQTTGYQSKLEWIDELTAGTTIQLYAALSVAGHVGNTASYQGIYLAAELMF